MDRERERSIPRRHFIRSAVAIGGASALTACIGHERFVFDDDRETTSSPTATAATDQTFPQGDRAALPDGQHEWNRYLVRDSANNTVPPQQQLVLGLSYEGTGPPTTAERDQVEAAFQTLERAFQWGTSGYKGATFNRGLLFLVGYAPSYFESFGTVPDDLIPAETLLEKVGEDPTKTDGFDAVVILTSDVGSIVLMAEQALLGEKDRINGIQVEGTLEGVFSVTTRRTGFAGPGIPADKLDQEAIPERAPLSMGFKSGFTDSLPAEDAVELSDGRFTGGTTLALSRLRLDLDQWYDQSHESRVEKMFCPAHTEDEVGPVGTNLGDDSGIEPEDVENIGGHAEQYNRVGHSAKMATARNDDFEPLILRRSEGFATDAPEHTGFNFSSIQRRLEAFVEARKAMNVAEYDVDVPAENHGIVDYVTTVDRGTYIVPSRDDRTLPDLGA